VGDEDKTGSGSTTDIWVMSGVSTSLVVDKHENLAFLRGINFCPGWKRKVNSVGQIGKSGTRRSRVTKRTMVTLRDLNRVLGWVKRQKQSFTLGHMPEKLSDWWECE